MRLSGRAGAAVTAVVGELSDAKSEIRRLISTSSSEAAKRSLEFVAFSNCMNGLLWFSSPRPIRVPTVEQFADYLASFDSLHWRYECFGKWQRDDQEQ